MVVCCLGINKRPNQTRNSVSKHFISLAVNEIKFHHIKMIKSLEKFLNLESAFMRGFQNLTSCFFIGGGSSQNIKKEG